MFFHMLKCAGITEYESEPKLFIPENFTNNLESVELTKKYDLDEGNYKSIRYLNFINSLRKNRAFFDLQQVGHILLTETRLTRIIASDLANESNEKIVPLAISLQSLTNRLWYDLNKGFGAKNFPQSLGVVVKARVVLASIIGQSITARFKDAKEKFRNGFIGEETMKTTIVELRSQSMNPEDITMENVGSIIEDLGLYEEEIGEYRDVNQRLRGKLAEKEKENLDLKNKAMKAEAESLQASETVKDVCQQQLRVLIKNKGLADQKSKKIICVMQAFFILIIMVFVILVLFLDSKKDKIITGGIGIIVTILPYIISAIYSLVICKKFDFLLAVNKMKECIRYREYDKYEVDESRIKKLSEICGDCMETSL